MVGRGGRGRVDIDGISIQIPEGNGQSLVWNQYCSNAMAQSSQRLFENGSMQCTSVQHSFELLYGYCTLCRELALVDY